MSKPRFTPSMQWVVTATGQMTGEAQRILRALIDAVALLEGTTTNDNAAAGQIGEEIYSDVLVADAVSLASTVAANVTSISLTAGDWDLTGFVSFQPAATTSITAMFASMNTTSATLSSDNGFAYAWTQNATVPNAIIRLNAMGPVRVSLASTTTYYLVTRATFTVDALTAFGLIRARRMR